MIDDEKLDRNSRLVRLEKAFCDREYRHGYMGRHIRGFLALQMKSLRGERTQKQFGDIIGKPQSVVSRLEKQADKHISIQTLIDIAAKLDVAVVIRFVDFPTFIKYTEDFSDEALHPAPYDKPVAGEHRRHDDDQCQRRLSR